MGIKTICFVEKDKYCQRVLKKHWPDVPIIGDVKDVTKKKLQEIMANTDSSRTTSQTGERQEYQPNNDDGIRLGTGTTNRTVGYIGIDIVSGGFPCQPHSVAGRRKGSGDERNLWPEFRRILDEIKPRWVVAENVPGLFPSNNGDFFGGVLSDLAALGYVVGWCCYGANDVGALHRRDRVFIVAYSRNCAGGNNLGGITGQNSERVLVQGVGEEEAIEVTRPSEESQIVGYASQLHSDGGSDYTRGNTEKLGQVSQFRNTGSKADVSVTSQQGLQGRRILPKCANEQSIGQGSLVRHSSIKGLPDWAGGTVGQPSPLTEFERSDGTGKEQEIERDFCGVAHGVSSRVDRLKGLGNAVVPQQIYPIYKAIMDVEQIFMDEIEE